MTTKFTTVHRKHKKTLCAYCMIQQPEQAMLVLMETTQRMQTCTKADHRFNALLHIGECSHLVTRHTN